jgi:hypothetical protein
MKTWNRLPIKHKLTAAFSLILLIVGSVVAVDVAINARVAELSRTATERVFPLRNAITDTISGVTLADDRGSYYVRVHASGSRPRSCRPGSLPALALVFGPAPGQRIPGIVARRPVGVVQNGIEGFE